MRRAAIGIVTVIAICLGGFAPAEAAAKPGKVGLVTFTAASTSSLTVAWPKASNAKKYQVYVSTSYSGVLKVKKATVTTSKTTYRVTKLKPNTNYFIQVRARNGSKAGSRSSRVGHRTIAYAGPATGPVYSVMSYNVCSRVCEDSGNRPWAARLPGVLQRINYLQPDVVALQESECESKRGGPSNATGWWFYEPPAGYSEVPCKSAKRLLYKTARFDVAMTEPAEVCTESPPESPASTPPEPTSSETTPSEETDPTPEPLPTEPDATSTTEAPETSEAPATSTPAPQVAPAAGATCSTPDPEPRTGWILIGEDHGTPSTGLGDKFAVWAELIDKTTKKHIIFVSTHLVAGSTDAAANQRTREVVTLLTDLAAINTAKLPVIHAGDFNSHKARSNDTVSTVFRSASLYDAFDQARVLGYQHYNSFNGFRTTPTLGITWGDHVDHVWVDPRRTTVLSWFNAAKFVSGKYAAPLPSDHNPITVRFQVD